MVIGNLALSCQKQVTIDQLELDEWVDLREF